MFSRRHPLLFSFLVFSGISAMVLVVFAFVGLSIYKGFSQTGWEMEDDWGLNGDKVGVVEITGPITDPRTILKDLKKFRKNDSIKAIVVRVDSPGGQVGPSQEIFREINKTTDEKPIIVSMGSMAASGGYYVAAGASGIVANPGTLTGSIGVIMEFLNLKELFQKIGFSSEVIKSGEFKDMGSLARQLSSKERGLLQKLVDEVREQFIRAVSSGRNLEPEKVRQIADGRIFTGETAKEFGLVDRLGNFEDALDWAGELGGIQGEIETVYPRDKKTGILKYLPESDVKDLLMGLLKTTSPIEFVYKPGA